MQISIRIKNQVFTVYKLICILMKRKFTSQERDYNLQASLCKTAATRIIFISNWKDNGFHHQKKQASLYFILNDYIHLKAEILLTRNFI